LEKALKTKKFEVVQLKNKKMKLIKIYPRQIL